MGVLDRRDVAQLRGVKVAAIKAVQKRYPPGTPGGFPAPTGEKNGGPVWDESLTDELRDWKGRGRGVGGNQPAKLDDNGTISIGVPGAFDTFLSGTGGASGDDGETPFHLAYRAAVRVTRGRGYTLRLTFPVTEADEVLGNLLAYAETFIDTADLSESGARSELSAALAVAERCRALLDELPPAPAEVPVTGPESHADVSPDAPGSDATGGSAPRPVRKPPTASTISRFIRDITGLQTVSGIGASGIRVHTQTGPVRSVWVRVVFFRSEHSAELDTELSEDTASEIAAGLTERGYDVEQNGFRLIVTAPEPPAPTRKPPRAPGRVELSADAELDPAHMEVLARLIEFGPDGEVQAGNSGAHNRSVFPASTLQAMERRGLVTLHRRSQGMIRAPRARYTVARITPEGRERYERQHAASQPDTPAVVHVDVVEPGKAVVVGPGFQGRVGREPGARRYWVELSESDSRPDDVEKTVGHVRIYEDAGALLAEHHGLTNYTVEVDREK